MATKAKTVVSKTKVEVKKVIPKLEELDIAPKTKEVVSAPEEAPEPAQESAVVPEATATQSQNEAVTLEETKNNGDVVAQEAKEESGGSEKKPYVVPPSAGVVPQPIRSFTRAPLPLRVPFQPRFAPMRPGYQRVAQEPVITEEVSGILEMTGTDGRGILRHGFRSGEDDVLIPSMVSRLSKLRAGDVVTGLARRPKETEPYWTMVQITKVNGEEPSKMFDRFRFEKGTPIYPFEKLKLETGKEILSTRLIDLCAPIGRGQRGLIVSPPKAGKTTIIKEIASGIATNYPEIHLMAVLVGERPEEVTDISRHILAVTKDSAMPGETAASNFDEKAEEQTRVAEMALERAKRLVEMGKDVVILLDSITRLARAYNLAIPTSGRTLSGGFDPAALYPPKKFFGAARKIEGGGSLTIIGTALTDTGSRMDDLVYEEFKGTGNMELHLDRRLAERRIYPAIDVMRSGTRRDDLLFDSMEYQSIILMRRMLDMLGDNERTEVLIGRLARTKSNKEFLASLKDGG
ncbi:transcription termination factor Rho [Candidatus Collierbacteria bacterium RIFOXYB2_FULL_46_14]|uniref:Transcription termination factor Rho n=1 Tax=Candidatus Collierbacteria bacterium GW2011_GWA2_46_26 TaxID=1618381 RepID=A0A0G1PIE7_9BACT|nr:MAG: Transcription termination factor Rho [Candidatus Collierbacteria bacterium GW2011_GWA2_46_26]OGD73591.1 MAG: transcription termination factor Rho [Candidatus Collierbacteria bacterium RIFOXYB2_FULL_46_14]OGD76633.1 MAG: transcription termination factor Rho [Candidatus Collierbacteria bacterium RIFOXYA2_FULL_46_20]OGD77969.1 MAG: transcription termination factor Rho [Candidatus Collierbacteria bacterium RIFOXYC2_FULL_43_15]OGD79993.1 MAG: transcription termination factor Rho [Pseudomonad